MDSLCLIIINVISIVLVFISIKFWKTFRNKFQYTELFDLVAFVLFIKVCLYFLLPAILRVYSDWEKDREIGALPSEIVTVYVIEFLSILIWMSTIVTILFVVQNIRLHRRTSSINIDRRDNAPKSNWLNRFPVNLVGVCDRTSKMFLIVICVLFLMYFPYSMEAVLEVLMGDGNLIQPIVSLAGPMVGIYLFAYGRKRFGTFVFLLGTVVTIMSLVAAFAFGSRGQIVAIAIWLVFLYLFVTRNKFILYVALAGMIGVFFFHNAMTVLRADKEFQSRPFIEKATSLIVGLEEERGEKNDLLSSLEFRFGESSRMSVGFLRLVDTGTIAGLKPILASFYSPVPRRFIQDKPEQGSIDGTKEGMGMYIIHDVMDGSANMSEFYTGLHAYWELGLLGVFFLSALSGVFIFIYVISFGKLGITGLPLMMIMLKPPWLEPKLWISELISDFFHTLLPLVCLWFLIAVILTIYAFGKKILRAISLPLRAR